MISHKEKPYYISTSSAVHGKIVNPKGVTVKIIQRCLLVILCCLSLFFSYSYESEAKPVQSPATKTTYLSISTGDHHTCAVTTEGGVKCWGRNYDGEIGNGSQHPNYLPSDVVGLTSGVVAVSVGYSHSCALTTSGGVKCWGANYDGQLGDGTVDMQRLTPVDVSGLTSGVSAIKCGYYHSCALIDNGLVKCWGKNDVGQLGDATFISKNSPVQVVNLSLNPLMLSVGGGHNCIINSTGDVQCWGNNWSGQLGDNTTENRSTPVDVTGLNTGVTYISAGGNHTCAVLQDGEAQCWGWNDFGQLGNGNTAATSTPQNVLGLTEAIAVITAGYGSHTCAEIVNGDLVCWGANHGGQLGDGTFNNSLRPVNVSGLDEEIIAISLSGGSTCAVTSQGKAMCWGGNLWGTLGQGGTAYSAVPLFSGNGTQRFEQIDLGGKHGCGLHTDGSVQCWGMNNQGQLGVSDKYVSGTPMHVASLSNDTIVDIAAGGEHNCALTSEGDLKCWGSNWAGQLGDGNSGTFSTAPVNVINLDSTIAYAVAGDSHTCVLSTTGGVKCWGSNEYGQIGNGSSDTLEPIAVDVNGLTSDVIALTAGSYHTCAVTAVGAVKCWGYNTFYQLGDGTQIDSNIPVDVVGLSSGVTDISAGYDHTCALTDSESVICWGAFPEGGLVQTPQDITDSTMAVSELTAGGITTTCVITSSNIVKCLGRNQFGEVGNGTFDPTSSFSDVEGMTGNVESVVCERTFCCALVANGRMKCWGDNNWYKLGLGGIVNSPIPLEVIEIHLTSNYDRVSSGGYVVVTGTELEPNTTVNLYANKTFLGDTTTTSSGDLIFFLDTSQAGMGQYDISAYYGTRESSTQNKQLLLDTTYSTSFTIDNSSEAPIKEGDGLTFVIPENIGVIYQYLPLMIR